MTKKEQPAGFWLRILAFLIDFFILATLQRILNFSFRAPLRGIFSLVLSFGYGPLMLYQYRATLGKMALNLKVVSQDGKKLEVFQVLLREWVGKFISGAVFLLGFIWIGIDKKKQGWHDKIARTSVVRS